ncbi:discoidin domain-containing protein [Eubacteriales bacterium OttesenSCG-928-G02]|nr:discoidin domain-containing protein [Eubacteriales bacterium OttesenSCG-928-G02]
MKKLLSLLVAVLLVATMFTFGASAADAVNVKGITFESAEAGEVVLHNTAKTEALLIDGDTASAADHYDQAGVMLIKNTKPTEAGVHPEFSFIIELDERAKITAFEISYFVETNVMAGLPKDKSVTVEVSDNGTDFTLVDDFVFEEGKCEWTDAEKTAGVQTAKFDTNTRGKFVKFTFAFGDSPYTDKPVFEFIGFSEIAVSAEKVSADESSTAPVESSEESSKGTTTETGDNGFVAIAIISLIALAGAVVVKKVR